MNTVLVSQLKMMKQNACANNFLKVVQECANVVYMKKQRSNNVKNKYWKSV